MQKRFKYIFIFMFVLVSSSFLLTFFDGDVLWNYGFSYAISRGSIPYRDFNMVLTPFYPFLMSSFLLISKNILWFYLGNAFFVCCLFKILFGMFKEKAWIFLIFLVFPIPAVVFPSYNLFLVLLVFWIIYLEERQGNDYLIGFLVGLSILTKQSVGVFMIIPSIYYYRKDFFKLLKRVLGAIFPCLVFLCYLIFTGSLKSFINLCFLGLFDFSKSNGFNFNFSLILGIGLMLFSLVLFWKNKKSIRHLYVFLFSSIMIPLFDYPHIEYFFFALLGLLVDKINVNLRKLKVNAIIFSSCFVLIFFYFTFGFSNVNYPNHYHNFNFRLLINNNGEDEVRDCVIKYMKESKRRIVFLASDAYFYKITNDMDIDYFDLLNKGNHGFKGDESLIKMLDELEKGTLVIVDSHEVSASLDDSRLQFNKKPAKYVMKHFKKIDAISSYFIYEVTD